MKTIYALTFAVVLSTHGFAQDPVITNWRFNLDGATGRSSDANVESSIRGKPVDVQQVGYNATDVYVRASTIPSHDLGPFRNRNMPDDNNIVYRIPRSPQMATNPTPTSLGPVATCVNGVPLFNMLDARSYFNRGVWNQNAIVVEAPGFDAALGHPAMRRGSNGIYHYHQLPTRILVQEGDTAGKAHSPIVAWSFDGYPIYGPYAFANSNGTGGVTRMRSSYRIRSISVRQTLPSGQPLNPVDYGPVVSSAYPLGYYAEDFEYVLNLGDLDEFNGRFGVTPEYPQGTYAYFMTVDANGVPAYPYSIGPNYRGVPANNLGVRWPGGLTEYQPQTQITGRGCTDATLRSSGTPTIPSPNFKLRSDAAASTGGILYFLTARLSHIQIDVFSCPLFVDISQAPITLVGATNASGSHELALPIPQDNALIGVAVHAQNFATNFQATTTSNALTLLLK